jgi:hypothetical protein
MRRKLSNRCMYMIMLATPSMSTGVFAVNLICLQETKNNADGRSWEIGIYNKCNFDIICDVHLLNSGEESTSRVKFRAGGHFMMHTAYSVVGSYDINKCDR